MLVFGGDGTTTGGRYEPITDTWRATSTVGAPMRASNGLHRCGPARS